MKFCQKIYFCRREVKIGKNLSFWLVKLYKLRKLKEENGSLQKAQNKTAMSYDDIKSAINEVNNSKLDNREKLQRLLEIQQRAVFTQKSIIELKKELASLSKSVNNIQELES